MATKSFVTQEFLLVYCLVLAGRIYALVELLTTSDCTCVGYTATYQCTTAGDGGVTIWRGNEFNCPQAGDRILLIHERFVNGTRGKCSDGFVGQSLPYMEGDNNYSSRLTVFNVTSKLNGTTIKCVYKDIANNTEPLVNQTQLTLTTEPFDPPNDVHLVDAGQGYLLFSWSAVPNSCASLWYDISSTCGDCRIVTNTTSESALCTYVSHDAKECSFKIRSVICGNLTGRWSVSLTLKVPEPPVITDEQASYDANGMTEFVVADGDYARHQPTVIILASVLVAVLLMTVVGLAII